MDMTVEQVEIYQPYHKIQQPIGIRLQNFMMVYPKKPRKQYINQTYSSINK